VVGLDAALHNGLRRMLHERTTIIKRKWLTTYDQMASRPDDRIVMSWDIALREIESGDYSACVVLLIRKEIAYILEVVRGHFPSARTAAFVAARKITPQLLTFWTARASIAARAIYK
jgi:phage terminase large subunit-like protein